jgi:tetraacyldisaccharide 4'-kinase
MALLWRTPGFWWRSPPGLAARLLQPIGAIQGAITARRMARPGVSVAAPVVCVGNFTAGGTGKTPTALLIGQRLLARGLNPVFLSRGHGGRLAGPVRVDLEHHDAADVGDEPLLLAGLAPTVVAHDRVAGAAEAIAAGADVIVMDDGLQNPALAKTLRLAVIDAAVGFGNGLSLPAGPLRAPLKAQVAHADAALLIGDGPVPPALPPLWGNRPILRGRLIPGPDVAATLAGRRVIALAGIGRPGKFLDTLAACGASVIHAHIVPDHAPFAAADLAALAGMAAREQAWLVTTTKDRARMGRSTTPELAARLVVLPVTLELGDDLARLDALLEMAIQRGGVSA